LNDVPVHEDEPDLYSDARRYGGPLPAIAPGAIVEEEVTLRDTSVFFAGGQVERRALVKGIPVTKTRFVISHPESLPLHYVLQLLPAAKVKKSTENGIETITIENGPFAAFTEDTSFMPPDVLPYPEVEFSTGSSWQQVVMEYAHLVNDKLRLADVQPLVARANANSKGASRLDVVRRLVGALHKSVRYTGVEFGESTLVPQFPSETLKRKYGDCKDKATLLVAMLRAAGIPANLALLSAGPGQDVNTDLPGMGVFDHAIVYVPAAGADPELWIDATAQYSRVGVLPEMDYGRWALVVDEKTTSLKKIPELASTQNVHREAREFTLAEYGPARIVETNSQEGPMEAEYRDYYTGDPKKLRENSEKYVKNAYLADSLISLEKGDASDLDKPFTVTYTAKGRRGFSDRENAVVYVYPSALISGLPEYFETAEEQQRDDQQKTEKQKDAQSSDDDAENSEDSTPKKPRKFDWQFNPFVNEWHYKVTAPVGFKLRALPADKEEQLGSARYSQKFTANAEGTVAEAVLRFDSGKSRLTVEEGKKLRDAIVKAREADAIVITFDQIGYALLNQGKVREALASYQQLAQQHPKEALHRIQLARALLTAGLAEKARVVAREATALEPNSAQAYSSLAWILEHDAIGRWLKRGCDYQGAVAAYRKAKELDPKDKDIRANLAILLEYDAKGERYTAQAHLQEAVAEFRELKKLDEETGRTYDDNVLYDLWYARDFKTLEAAVSSLPATDARRGFVVALAAVNQGADAALKKSLAITSSEDLRRKALTAAGWLVLRLHKYSEAGELLAAGARGSSTEAQTAAFAANIKKTRPREEIKIEDDPRGAIHRFYSTVFSTSSDYDQMLKLMSRNTLRSSDMKKEGRDFLQSMYKIRVQTEKNGVPFETVGDIVLSNVRYSMEGNDAQGYRVTVETPGAEPQQAFVVREDGAYKLLDFSFGSKLPENLGWQALDLLNKNDLPGARKWLDWAREKIHMGGSDDPLSVQLFPYFWTKGQEGDADAIRTAALVLVPSKELQGDDLKALLQARDKAKTDQDKSRLDLVAAWAYSRQERWAELAPVADRLLQAFPDSITAFHFVTRVDAKTLRFDDWNKLVQERLARHADELDYTRSAAELAEYRGDFARSRQLIKELMDRSKATQTDLNSFAWAALFLPGEIGQDSIEAAERANQLTQNANFSVMHTLACLYARTGKAVQARELLLKAIETEGMLEPDSSVWLALAEIAEQYGEADAARTMYARVEKGDTESPTSNYSLAQQRLLALKSAPVTAASKAGK
jgi:tetratricopeptide (TPR) repeat protein